MADLKISNNVQVLPPLKDRTTPGSRGVPVYAPSQVTKSGSVNSGVNIARGAGVSLYDTVNTAMSGKSSGQQAALLGSIVDIKA